MWRSMLGNMLIVLATSVLLIELGEFAVLAYVWGIATGEKVVSVFDNAVVFGVTLVTLTGTLLLSAAALMSMHRRRAWPTSRLFGILAAFVATTQMILLLLGTVNFEGAWLNDFFGSKSSTFAAGMLSAFVLIAACLIVRPWGSPPKGTTATISDSVVR